MHSEASAADRTGERAILGMRGKATPVMPCAVHAVTRQCETTRNAIAVSETASGRRR